MKDQKITFSFGRNWQSYLKSATQEAFRDAQKDIETWLGPDSVAGKSVLDIGCGSGIHSLGFYALQARRLVSFDVDPHSVEATRSLREKVGRPAHWTVTQGSVLDEEFMRGLGLGAFDIVYAWGVLHHTGAMWQAVENAGRMVAPAGRFWIALYAKTPRYLELLRLKQRYNAASWFGKKIMVWKYIYHDFILERWRHGQNPLTWNQRTTRGMDIYHDAVDWHGGLPYEVAHPVEVESLLQPQGFKQEKVFLAEGVGNHIYLYRRQTDPEEKVPS